MVLAPYAPPDVVIPGVTGGIARGIASLASRYGGRGAKRLARYVFNPGKKTISGAVRRGTGLGILVSFGASFDEQGDLITIPEIPIRKTTYNVKQRGYRRNVSNRRCRRHHRLNCCYSG